MVGWDFEDLSTARMRESDAAYESEAPPANSQTRAKDPLTPLNKQKWCGFGGLIRIYNLRSLALA